MFLLKLTSTKICEKKTPPLGVYRAHPCTRFSAPGGSPTTRITFIYASKQKYFGDHLQFYPDHFLPDHKQTIYNQDNIWFVFWWFWKNWTFPIENCTLRVSAWCHKERKSSYRKYKCFESQCPRATLPRTHLSLICVQQKFFTTERRRHQYSVLIGNVRACLNM